MKKFNAVGMHIYAGGFSLGMQKHFDVKCHLEELDLGTETFRQNCPEIPVYLGKPNDWPLDKLRNVDVLFCNPPCNSWSACSATVFHGGDNWRTDARTNFSKTCFKTFVRLRPHIFVWESVTRAYTLGRELVDGFIKVANGEGYDTTILLIDLAKIGGSQQRRRFLFVAHDVQVDFRHQPAAGPTPRELLKDIKPTTYPQLFLSPDVARLAQCTKVGHGLRETFDKLVPVEKRQLKVCGSRTVIAGRPSFMRVKLDPDAVCPTLTSFGLLHWDEPRMLAPNEFSLLMGYPKTYQFAGPPETHVAQIAKGVSPVVGDFMGHHLVKALKASRPLSGMQNKVLDYR